MKNNRLSPAAFLAPLGLGLLGLLTPGAAARAALTLDNAFDTDGIAPVDIASGGDVAREVAVQADGALVLAGRSRQVVGANTFDYVALTRVSGTTGALDSSFGTAGIVKFLPGLTAANGYGGDGRALAIQPADQKIIVAGSWKPDQAGATQAFVARLNTDGELDDSFGTDGVVLFTPAGVTDPVATAIALRSDGGILVVGTGAPGEDSVGFVSALDSDGEPLAGYSNSVISNPLASGRDFGFTAVTVLSGDRVLAGGGGGDLTLAQFTSNGAPDTTFDADGIASFNVVEFDTVEGTDASFDVITALAVLDDGRILMAGRAGPGTDPATSNPILGRVTSGGELDTGFGSGGFAPLGDFAVTEVPDGLGVRPSGDIVLVGQGIAPTQVSPNGIAVLPLAGSFAPILGDLKVLAGGDIVAAGRSTVGAGNTAFAAVRFAATDLADGPDTVPDPFGFETQRDLDLGFTATSNAVTISGLSAPATIRVSNGSTYSIGCSTFTAVEATISNGQTVCVRGQASQAGLSVRTVVLNVGGVLGQFTLVTGDTFPDQFTFVDQPDVSASAVVTSAAITPAGFDTRTSVSVTGGLYSVGCAPGGYTGSAGLVDPGAEICVRHTSSPSPGGVTNTVLAVGGVSDTFTSTTIGDITPDVFSFPAQPDVPKSTVITSAQVTLTGFTSNAPITVTGGQYSIGCTASFTAVAGSVAPNSTVCVRHTSSAAGGTATTTTLSVGVAPGVEGRSGVFTSTTTGQVDTTPDAFSFVDQTSVPLAAVITSGTVSIGGFDTPAPISITGGTYSVNCTNSFTSVTGTLAPNTLVCVRHTSPAEGGASTNTVLTVGGVSDTFTSTTLAGDAAPAQFTFTDQTGVDLFETITSAPVTVTGIDIASPVAVTGGAYSIGCTSTFTTAAANITNGQTICVRHTSSFNSSTTVETTLTIGTTSDTFSSTTRVGDQLPDDISFTSQTGVALNTLVRSNTITIEGVDSPVTVVVSGGTNNVGYALDCGDTFGENGAALEEGDTLCLVALSPNADNTSLVVTLTVGGSDPGNQKTANFTITTGETTPDGFTFTDQVGVPLLTTVYSAPITITGITGPSRVEISGNGQYQINCTGTFTGNAGLVEDGQTICVRHVSAGSLSTQIDTVLTVGGISDTFTTTTTDETKPLPGSSAIDPWTLLLLGPLAGYRRRRAASR